MGVLGALPDDDVEVGDGLLVLINHLVGLGPLVDVAEVAGDLLDAARVGEDRLFELLQPAVRQAQVVEDVSLVCEIWLGSEGHLHRLDALLVLFVLKVYDALLVKHLRVLWLQFERSIQVIN